MPNLTQQYHKILFWFAIAGIVFYIVGPIMFPKVPNLRQPELLPLYTLMLGLGQLLKGSQILQGKDPNATDKKEEKTSDS